MSLSQSELVILDGRVQSVALPQDLVDRLTAIGEDPQRFEPIWYSEDELFIRGLVSSLEESASLYRKWSPVLRDFAVECRRVQPCPLEETLPPRDQAKVGIYETMIRKAERLPHENRGVAVIFALPLWAIPIAQRLWPGDDDRGVFLTPDELTKWREIYTHPEDAFWWFIHYWWDVEDPPQQFRFEFHSDISDIEVPKGEPWLAVSGLCWGSLAGGEDVDLWSWEGEKATFVRNFCMTTF